MKQTRTFSLPIRWSAILFCALLPGAASAQQAAAPAAPLVIKTTTLPRANLRRPFRVALAAEGGVVPLYWQCTSGSLPPGLSVSENGILAGLPSQVGDFRFTLTVSDSAKPASQRNQELLLRVVTPLLAEWSQYPHITGQRLEGSIKVSNGTEQDFDLTVIMLAVNEVGRATAVGYQHFNLRKDTSELEIPFGENLPAGAYDLHVDVVAEVPSIEAIYRVRLVSKEKLQVVQGP